MDRALGRRITSGLSTSTGQTCWLDKPILQSGGAHLHRAVSGLCYVVRRQK